jgi:hypothetical protein
VGDVAVAVMEFPDPAAGKVELLRAAAQRLAGAELR